MGSKVLKAVKEQNAALDEAVEAQKQQEKEAKAAYKESKCGIFASKEDKIASKQAKVKYEQEKVQTQEGKQLQKSGKQLKSLVSSDSRGVLFHSDKNLSSETQELVSEHVKSVESFQNQNVVYLGAESESATEATAAEASTLDTAATKAQSAATKSARLLPYISSDTSASDELELG